MRYVIFLVALLASSDVVSARECSIGAGVAGAMRGQGSAHSASFGCVIGGAYDLRLHYIGELEALAPVVGYLTPARITAGDQLAFSVMRYWRLPLAKQIRPSIGIGAFLKEDERADAWEWCGDFKNLPGELRCVTGNPWVPSPLSFIGALRFERNAWSVRFGHISNKNTSAPNWGLEFLQFEHSW